MSILRQRTTDTVTVQDVGTEAGTENGSGPAFPTWVVLQPIAAPSVLGWFAFAGATFVVAAWMAGWYGSPATPDYLFPFAALVGGMAQFLAGMWSYRARDVLATAMHGTWGAFWLGWGVLWALFATGRLQEPTGTFSSFGYWFIAASKPHARPADANRARTPAGLASQLRTGSRSRGADAAAIMAELPRQRPDIGIVGAVSVAQEVAELPGVAGEVVVLAEEPPVAVRVVLDVLVSPRPQRSPGRDRPPPPVLEHDARSLLAREERTTVERRLPRIRRDTGRIQHGRSDVHGSRDPTVSASCLEVARPAKEERNLDGSRVREPLSRCTLAVATYAVIGPEEAVVGREDRERPPRFSEPSERRKEATDLVIDRHEQTKLALADESPVGKRAGDAPDEGRLVGPVRLEDCWVPTPGSDRSRPMPRSRHPGMVGCPRRHIERPRRGIVRLEAANEPSCEPAHQRRRVAVDGSDGAVDVEGRIDVRSSAAGPAVEVRRPPSEAPTVQKLAHHRGSIAGSSQ